VLKHFRVTAGYCNFAEKMERKQIEAILANGTDDFFERFYDRLVWEIDNDDEPYDKKGRQLLEACLSNPSADDFFIAICGWSLKSLLDKVK